MRNSKRLLPKEVFISHSHQDRDFVNRLTGILRFHRVKYWYSPKHIVGAERWHDEIGKALVRCDWFLIVLSPHAVESKWVKHEYLYAVSNQRFEGKIVPVIYKPCVWEKFSWTLQSLQWVNFKKDYQALAADLLKTWGL